MLARVRVTSDVVVIGAGAMGSSTGVVAGSSRP